MLAMKGDRHVHVCSLRGCWAPVWATFSSQISFKVIQDPKTRQDGTQGRSVGEAEGSGFVTDSWWFSVEAFESLCVLATLRNLCYRYLQNRCAIFWALLWFSFLDQESWKLEFFHLRNAPKHRKLKGNTHLQPRVNRTPSHMGLIWRWCPLTEASPGEHQSWCRKHALMRPLSKHWLSSLDIFLFVI